MAKIEGYSADMKNVMPPLPTCSTDLSAQQHVKRQRIPMDVTKTNGLNARGASF